MENTRTLAQVDPDIAALIRKETERQEEGLELIASENFVSPNVLRVQGCSTFEPVSRGAYTEDAQAINRRVEVEATDMLVEERQDRSRPAPAALRIPSPASGAPTPARLH